MPTFRTRSESQEVPDSPEALFRDLRPRDRQVRDLYLRQGDVLRAYHELSPTPTDVALELPTGAGKTLVGLLIAEYRRRAFGQRVAFLCPNVQLARQAATKAASYGIDAVALVRRQRDWDPADFQRFQRGRAIAVSTYSALFNSNPRLDSAQTLVLDDAHAGEDPVASMWSIRAARDSELYRALLALVEDALPNATVDRLRDDTLRGKRRDYVELVPPIALFDREEALRDALAAHCSDRTPNAYVLNVMGDWVHRCMLYFGWREVLLRPLIPPTADHAPFAGADQRIYMSATPGSGGELERAFGVAKISRPQMPSRDDERGFGRRLFLMPGAALNEADADATIADAIAMADPQRAVLLAQSDLETAAMEKAIVPEGSTIVTAAEIERSAESFTKVEPAILLLANRYDGIDLPDQACRLIVMSGLPRGVHLQERFIGERLGATKLLGERIRTRLTQGAGRCTRNPQDFAAVLLRGSDLIDFCSRDEELRALRPELQAEIEFGLDNSEETEPDFLGLLTSFFEQDGDWDEADQYVRTRTAEKRRELPPGTVQLQESAPLEVQCWLQVSRGELTNAVALAQQLVEKLSGGEEMRPYRALWFYLAASWSRVLAEQLVSGYGNLAESLQRDAASAARGLRWTPRHSRPPASDVEPDERAQRAAECLVELGTRGRKFEDHLASVGSDLSQSAAGPFERGLERLGTLLGFAAVRPTGQAAPDGLWATDGLWIVWEAKTNKKPDGALDAEEVRQAETHPRWVERKLKLTAPPRVITVIVMPEPRVDGAVPTIAGDQWIVSTDSVRRLFQEVASIYRGLRLKAPGLDDVGRSTAFATSFDMANLSTAQLSETLTKTSVALAPQ